MYVWLCIAAHRATRASTPTAARKAWSPPWIRSLSTSLISTGDELLDVVNSLSESGYRCHLDVNLAGKQTPRRVPRFWGKGAKTAFLFAAVLVDGCECLRATGRNPMWGELVTSGRIQLRNGVVWWSMTKWFESVGGCRGTRQQRFLEVRPERPSALAVQFINSPFFRRSSTVVLIFIRHEVLCVFRWMGSRRWMIVGCFPPRRMRVFREGKRSRGVPEPLVSPSWVNPRPKYAARCALIFSLYFVTYPSR